MRSLRSIILTACVALLFARVATSFAFDLTNVVTFDDPNVEYEVQQQLNQFDRPLTQNDLLALTVLQIGQWYVPFSFGGLEYATNIAYLATSLNNDTPLEPLVGLPHLKEFAVGGWFLTDATPLLALTNVESFVFNSSAVTNIEILSKHPSLSALFFRSSGVTNASPFTNFSIANLSLTGNSIADVTPLLSMSELRYLGLSENPLTNVHQIGRMTNLTGLDLTGLTQCEFLTNLSALELLFLNNGNSISNLSPLKSLSRLNNLAIGGNPKQDCSFLSNFPSLKVLDAYRMGLKDISMLLGATNMEHLNLDNNEIQDLTPLASMTHLKGLFANLNWITNVAVLTNCPELRALYLRSNYLFDTNYEYNVESRAVFQQVAERGGFVQIQTQRLWGEVKLRVTPDNGAMRIQPEPTPTNLIFRLESSPDGKQWTPNYLFGPLSEKSILIYFSESNQFFRTSIAY